MRKMVEAPVLTQSFDTANGTLGHDYAVCLLSGHKLVQTCTASSFHADIHSTHTMPIAVAVHLL